MLSKVMVAGALMAAGVTSVWAADLGGAAPPPPAPVPFFIVNDNTLSFSYQFTATDPGFPGATAKKVLNFTHFDIWAYGTNFLTIDMLSSDKNDPASPCTAQGMGCPGAREIYGLFRSTLGLNELFHTKTFSAGPLSDVSFEFGADANTENNFLAPAKLDIVAGLEFTFALPYQGHLNISPLLYKEWNHNAFLMTGQPVPAALPCLAPKLGFFGPTCGPTDGNTDFRTTWDLEVNYALPLGFLPDTFPLTLSGYANWHGPKGTGVSPLVSAAAVAKTVVELNSEQRLTLDVGKMIGGASYSHYFDLWVGYRYWKNKFGLDSDGGADGVCLGADQGGCTEQSWVTGVSVTF